MEGQIVDNSVPSASPAPAAPEPAATPAPEVAPEPTPAQTGGPPPRDPAILNAILDGADPTKLFGQPEPAADPAPQPALTPEGTPPAPAEPRFQIPDKFLNPDGTPNVEAMAKSYTELERAFGEQGNKLGTMTQLFQEITTKGQPPAATAPAAEPEPAVEIPKFPWEEELSPEEREQALEEFYADPLAAQAKRDQQTIKAMEYRFQKTLENVLKPLTPVVEKQQYEAEVNNYTNLLNDFAQAHPDVQEVLPAMQIVAGTIGNTAIKAMEKAGQNPLEAIYAVAKGLHRPAPPTPEQLIADPNYRQKIVSDPNIKNEILKSTVTDIKAGQPPTVIGSQAGVPPATPAEKPKSAREATSMLSRMLLRGQ